MRAKTGNQEISTPAPEPQAPGPPKVGGFRTAPEKEAGVARDHGSQRGRHAARWAGTHGQNAGGGEQTATPQTTRIALRAPLGGGPSRARRGPARSRTRHPRGSIAMRTGREERHFFDRPRRPRSPIPLETPSRRTRHGPRCAPKIDFSDLSPARATSLAGWCREGLAHARRARKTSST